MRTNILFLLTLGVYTAISFSSCRKEGCTDPAANNYDEEAKLDDNSCTYDPTTGELTVAFQLKNGSTALSMGDSYTDTDGNTVKVERCKFFVNNVSLIASDNSLVPVTDIELIDFEEGETSFSMNVEPGTYTGLSFYVGVDSALNATDPATYESSHPLSTFNDMYWTWATMYRFVIYEGKADPAGGSNFTENFVYHTGTNALYSDEVQVTQAINLAAGGSATQNITINANKVFHGTTDVIDVTTDNNTHTMDDMPLAVRFMDNFVDALE